MPILHNAFCKNILPDRKRNDKVEHVRMLFRSLIFFTYGINVTFLALQIIVSDKKVLKQCCTYMLSDIVVCNTQNFKLPKLS